MHTLGVALADLQQTDEARSWLSQALDLRREFLVANSRRLAATLRELGYLELRDGREPRAKELLDEAVDILAQNHPPGHSQIRAIAKTLTELDTAQGAGETAADTGS